MTPADHRDFGRYFRSEAAPVLKPGVSDPVCANVRQALQRLDLHSNGMNFSPAYDETLQEDVKRMQVKYNHSSADGLCGPGTRALLVRVMLETAGPTVFKRMHDPQQREDGQAFISYARADLDRVRPFIEMTRGWGYEIWYDDSITAGSVWSDVLRTEIDRSYLVFAFLSAKSVKRKWVRKEIKHASSSGKPVLSIMIDPLRPSHPLTATLAKHQHLSLQPVAFDALTEDLKARLAQALREAHAKRPPSKKPPPPPILGARTT